jgi:kynureninase
MAGGPGSRAGLWAAVCDSGRAGRPLPLAGWLLPYRPYAAMPCHELMHASHATASRIGAVYAVRGYARARARVVVAAAPRARRRRPRRRGRAAAPAPPIARP